MHALTATLIIMSCIVLLFCIIISTITYFENTGGAKLKFKTFKSFYNINPDRWDLYDGSVICKDKDYRKQYFHFGLIDYIKYKFWRRNLDKHEKEKEEAESIARMIDTVKEDIRRMDLCAQQELEQAKREMGIFSEGLSIRRG